MRYLTIDPDAFSNILGKVGETWNNKVGGSYSLILRRGNTLNIGARIGGFVNINNFDRGGFFSWQLWRGSPGLYAFFELRDTKWLSKGKRLWIEIGYSHESQHITDLTGYQFVFIDRQAQNLRINPVRSFEYFKTKVSYSSSSNNDRWQLTPTLGYKLFPNPLQSFVERDLTHAVFAEIAVNYKIKRTIFLYGNAYYEAIYNRFSSEENYFKESWEGQAFQYRMAEIGLSFINSKDQFISLFLSYTKSNGRGMDFLKQYEEIGWGMRVVL